MLVAAASATLSWVLIDVYVPGVPLPVRVTGYAVGLSALASLGALAWRRKMSSAEQTRLERTEALSRVVYDVHSQGRPPSPAELDPYSVGVARSHYSSTGLDPYIPRGDADEKLDAALAAAACAGSPLVIVRGHSKAGKSRSAFEAIRRNFPDAAVLTAREGRLRELAHVQPTWDGPTLLWLDNLERFLVGEDRLSADVLRDLCARFPGLVIVGTITSGRYLTFFEPIGVKGSTTPELRADPALDSAFQLDAKTRMVVEMSHQVDLPVDLTPLQRVRAQELYPREEFDRGPGEQLVAAWEHDRLYATCSEADPACWAVIRAAIDWRRMGVTTPIRKATLQRLAVHYLPGEPDGLQAAAVEAAIERAQVLPKDAPVKALGWSDSGFVAFDYLVELADGRGGAARLGIPRLAWDVPAKEAPLDELVTVARHVTRARGDQSVLRPMKERLLATTDEELRHSGRLLEGVLQLLDGDYDQAHVSLTAALESKSDELRLEAVRQLGFVARSCGDIDDALRLFREAADAGNRTACRNVAWLAWEQGDRETAEDYYQRGAEAGDPAAMFGLGWVMERLDRPVHAERWYTAAAEAGEVRALRNLGELARRAGNFEVAASWLRRALGAGDAVAAFPLASIARETGDLVEAETLYKAAAEAGVTTATTSLGWLSHGQGKVSTAMLHFLTAAAAGDGRGAASVAAVAKERSEVEVAKTWLLRAKELGDTGASIDLGILAYEEADLQGAEKWWSEAAEHGHPEAIANLGDLAREQERFDDAAGLYETALSKGSAAARRRLGALAFRRGDIDEARAWFMEAVEHGDEKAFLDLGVVAAECGEYDDAEAWYQKAVDSGSVDALFNMGLLHQMRGRMRSAQDWYRRAAAAGDREALTQLATMAADRAGHRRPWRSRSGRPVEFPSTAENPKRAPSEAEALAWAALGRDNVAEARRWFQAAAELEIGP